MKQRSSPHTSVLVDEVLHYLNPKPGSVYLDVTFGAGGHSRAILEKEPACSLVVMDWDKTVLETYGVALQEEFPERVTLLWGNFALLYKLLKKAKINRVDGILADFGTSQIQIAERPGFSIYKDTPLDMRMSPAHQKITAAEVVNKASEEKLREIFWEFGQERHAKYIVRAIVEERKKKKLLTTGQLAELVDRVVPKDHTRKIHSATRVFQALRIYVNKELENIELLATGFGVLNPGGRMVCISFHSLEDRLVKQFFKEKEQEGKVSILTARAVIASDIEIQKNSSSRSAKLRAAEKEEVL